MNSTTQEFNSSCNLECSAKPGEAGQQREELSGHKCPSKDRGRGIILLEKTHTKTTDSNTQMSLGPTTSGISQRSPHLKVPATPCLGDNRVREEHPGICALPSATGVMPPHPQQAGRPQWAGRGGVGERLQEVCTVPSGAGWPGRGGPVPLPCRQPRDLH